MLIQFSFSNYKSFREEAILDMTATKITEHMDRIVAKGNEKLLLAAAIYGANASGKSNVLEAFRFMKQYVANSFAYGGDSNEDEPPQHRVVRTPFLFDNYSKSKPSTFEVFFALPGDEKQKTYNYGFSIEDDRVKEEWLNIKAKSSSTYKSVFYREEDKLDISGLPKAAKNNILISLEKEVLVVSLGAKLKIEILKAIRDWFYTVVFVDFGNPIENAILSLKAPPRFADDKEVQKKVVNYFGSFDSSIVGFKVEKTEKEDGKEGIKIDALHKKEEGGTIGIPLADESDGTLKMFALFPSLHKVLETGGILCIDELNARLHPLLVRNLLISFLNPEINKNNAQIVFTTHDAWQLSNNLLRRDEIWFTEKNAAGNTSLYSLADIVDETGDKIRKDENYERNYLLGKYGAVPELRNIDVQSED